jgi:hypothetical protein
MTPPELCAASIGRELREHRVPHRLERGQQLLIK